MKNEHEIEVIEKPLVKLLIECGWVGKSESTYNNLSDLNQFKKDNNIELYNVDEQDLIENWRKILFQNNRDRLNNNPLTDEEMQDIMDQIQSISSPSQANTKINGGEIRFRRKNENDECNGKDVVLKIFDRRDIKAGSSVYQIARQVKFSNKFDNRADIILLINGLPLIHIELKNHTKNLSDAIHQIRNYVKGGAYKGLFSLIQLSVAMKPDEMMFIPATNDGDKIKPELFQKWTDKNNNPINNMNDVVKQFLCIPTAHRIIADFTVADDQDKDLKILRSYQFHAIDQIQKYFIQHKPFSNTSHNAIKGGYVWHTTGSGKTLTSYKLCKLLLDWNYADVVVFVVDRIELSTQTREEYEKFSEHELVTIKYARSSRDLFNLMLDNNQTKTIIITSIQKQSRIDPEKFNPNKFEKLSKKRVVSVFDEAHRSVSGDMMSDITHNFPNSVIFGFTGTPIKIKNSNDLVTTEEVFGKCLHTYTIKNGIRDKKVLCFDTEYPTFEKLYKDAFKQIRPKLANNEIELINTYDCFKKCNLDENYEQNAEFEAELKERGFYDTDEFKNALVVDMLKLWHNRSGARNFSAILATSKIDDAIKYFEIINQNPLKPADFKFTLLYDPTLDREEDEYEKLETRRDNIEAVIAQYNKDFNTNWKFETHAEFKKDLACRLARKHNFVELNNNENKNKRLDLLIVVNQMLTGFDSKYINTIYFDKTLQYQNLIQAISRTNRILDESTKPFGKVVYYRMPNTMNFNTREAFKIYAEANLNEVQVKDINDFYNKLNEAFKVIKSIFVQWGYANFEDILEVEPSDSDFILYKGQVKKIVLNYYKIHKYLNCIKLKGFTWENNADKLQFTRDDILKINARLRDINLEKIRGTDASTYEYDSIEINEDYNAFADIVDTAQENIDYKYLQKLIINENINVAEIENEFAKMPKWKAQIARNVLNNIKLQFNGIVPNTIDFQAELQKEIEREENSKIEEICNAFELNSDKLKEIINSNDELNSYGRLDELLDNSLNEATKQYIANIKDINPKKVKKHHIRSHIEEFIYSMRDKRNRQ